MSCRIPCDVAGRRTTTETERQRASPRESVGKSSSRLVIATVKEVLFSDESRFGLVSDDYRERVWRERGGQNRLATAIAPITAGSGREEGCRNETSPLFRRQQGGVHSSHPANPASLPERFYGLGPCDPSTGAHRHQQIRSADKNATV
nr:unnamed protein product [Callosobruchus chinensis]